MRRTLPLLLGAALVAATALADGPGLVRLFPREADVHVDGQGLARLDLPAEVLRACRPDLSDLRLFDPAGAEVPFLVDSGAPAAPTGVRQRIPATVVNVRQTQQPRGDGAPSLTEEYELELPAVEPEGGAWDLELTVSRREFARRVTVTAPVDAILVKDATVFRLPQAGREKLRVALPPLLKGPGRIAIVITGQDLWPLAPSFAFASARAFTVDRRVLVPLEITSRQQAAGRTILEVARPRGLVPAALRVATTTEAFDRPLLVADDGPGAAEPGAGPLGEGAVFRVPTRGLVAEELELPLMPARGDRLRVELADGDSPALRELTVVAVVERPALVFALAPGAGGAPAGLLRFGGGRAFRPRYDLAGLAAAGAAGERGRAALRLYDPAQLGAARLGPPRANPAFDPAPALAFAMRPGAPVDARQYRHRRIVTVGPTPEGLARIRLAPADGAGARPDLADLRVVDRTHAQWPYLLEPDAAREWVGTPSRALERAAGVTRYRLALPATPLRLDAVALTIDAPFFDRAYRLLARTDGAEAPIATGRLVRRDGDRRPATIDVAPQRVAELVLEITDGDDAPLALTEVRARALVADLYLAAPAGSYTLLLGFPEDAAPRYELGRVREVALAVTAAAATVGPLEANPDFTVRARLAQGSGPGQLALWLVLGVAVLALGGLTLRLARREAPAAPPATAAPPAPGAPAAPGAPPPPPTDPAPPTAGGTPPPA
jgi:hypothetical protein